MTVKERKRPRADIAGPSTNGTDMPMASVSEVDLTKPQQVDFLLGIVF